MFYIIIFYSFWGQFEEKQNKPQTHLIHTGHQLFHLLNEPVYDIRTVCVCTEDVKKVVTTQAEETLETLQERVLYYDTDSVVYRWHPGQLEIPLGNFLGQFTDETDGDPVIKFASSGAKNYGYLTHGGKTKCKVSGFYLNFKTKQTLKYNSMRDNSLLLAFIHLFLCPEF